MSSLARSLSLVCAVVLVSPACGLSPTQQQSSLSATLQSRPALRARGSGDGPLPPLQLVAAKPKPVVESPVKGYIAVLGGLMIHLACGSMYCWGNLISYLPASLKYWSPSGGTGPADAQLVLAFTLVAQMTGMPFGPLIEKKLGPRLTAAIGSVMMGSGIFLASYAQSLLSFVLSYSVLFGLGVGVAYQMPFLTGGRWFPAKKGTIQGSILAGMGASAFLFNIVATRFINPASVDMVGGAFPPEVMARWPALLRMLGITFTLLSFCGAMLQSNPTSAGLTYPAIEFLKKLTGSGSAAPAAKPAARSRAPVAAAPSGGPSVLSSVCSTKFLLLWVMILNSAVSGLNIASSYKTFGMKQAHLNSDAFLTLVGSLAALGGNSAGRLFWGSLSDKIGFKTCFSALTLLQGLVMYNYGRLASFRPTFLLATVFMLFCMGGNFAMFPAQTFRVFGSQGATVYSVLFTAFGSAALLGPMLSTALMQKGGYPLVYTTLSLMSAIAFTLCRLFL